MIESDEHTRVRDAICDALGSWRAFIIAVDGVDGAGKSTLARYLSWQLGMPVIETDLFLDQEAGGLNYRLEDLRMVIAGRLTRNRPVIVEGIRVQLLLQQLDWAPDLAVWVEQIEHEGSHRLQHTIDQYKKDFDPIRTADVRFEFRLIDNVDS